MNTTRVVTLSVAALFSLTACTSNNLRNQIPEPDDFQAYPSARAFDPPGRIYRVQPDGQIFGVTEISVTPHSGAETRPTISTTSDFSFGTVLNSIGVAAESLPASLNADLGRKREMRIESVSGTREWLDDTDLDARVPSALVGVRIRPDNQYFIVRETISASSINYKVSRSWITGGEAEAQIKSAVGVKATLKWNSDDTVELNQTFSSPMRIWYKAEALDISPSLGAGPGQPPTVAIRPMPASTRVVLSPQAPTAP